MSIICSECEDDVGERGISVSKGILKDGEVKEGKGYILCYKHFSKIEEKVHPLEDLNEGLVVIVDERGNPGRTGNMQWCSPAVKIRNLGYLSVGETEYFFPNTYFRIFWKEGNKD